MTWEDVARKEFQDAVRSKGLWALSAVFSVLFIAPVVGALYFDFGRNRFTQEIGMQFIVSNIYLDLVTFLLPVIAVFAGYAAVSKERTTGSIKLLLSLPHSRRDVIVGKVLGRCAVVGVPLAIAFGLTALFLVLSKLTFKPGIFGMWALFSFVFTIVIVAVAVSISGAVPRNAYSLLGNIVFYMEITFLWNLQVNSVASWVADNVGFAPGARWQLAFFAKLFNPSQAYKTLVNSELAEGANAARNARFGMFNQDAETMQTICTDALYGNATVRRTLFGNQTVCQDAGQSVPFWLSDPAVFVYLAAWVVLAAAVSYYTFNRGDL